MNEHTQIWLTTNIVIACLSHWAEAYSVTKCHCWLCWHWLDKGGVPCDRILHTFILCLHKTQVEKAKLLWMQRGEPPPHKLGFVRPISCFGQRSCSASFTVKLISDVWSARLYLSSLCWGHQPDPVVSVSAITISLFLWYPAMQILSVLFAQVLRYLTLRLFLVFLSLMWQCDSANRERGWWRYDKVSSLKLNWELRRCVSGC